MSIPNSCKGCSGYDHLKAEYTEDLEREKRMAYIDGSTHAYAVAAIIAGIASIAMSLIAIAL